MFRCKYATLLIHNNSTSTNYCEDLESFSAEPGSTEAGSASNDPISVSNESGSMPSHSGLATTNSDVPPTASVLLSPNLKSLPSGLESLLTVMKFHPFMVTVILQPIRCGINITIHYKHLGESNFSHIQDYLVQLARCERSVAIGSRDVGFNSMVGQIGHSLANDSPPLRCFLGAVLPRR